MNQKYLGLLCDFDGTLHIRDQRISPGVTQAIQRVLTLGVRFGIITGRSFDYVQPFIKNNNLGGVHVACAGTQLVDNSGQVLQEHRIPAETMRTVAEDIKAVGGHLVLKQNGFRYTNDPNFVDDPTMRPLSEVENWDTPSFYVTNLDEESWQQLAERTDISLYRQRSRFIPDMYFADGVAPGGGKKMGALWWADYHGISPEQVIGIGDGENDLGLFEGVGLKLAMGNGVPELKAVADEVIPSVEEDGIVYAIHKYFGI